jgi:hypothetical protein
MFPPTLEGNLPDRETKRTNACGYGLETVPTLSRPFYLLGNSGAK